MGVTLIERKMKKGRIALVLNTYYDNKAPLGLKGKQIFKATGFVLTGEDSKDDRRNDKEARIGAERMLQRAREEYDRLADGEESPAQNRDRSFVQYWGEMIATRNTENTRHSWETALDHFKAFLFETYPMMDKENVDISFREMNRDVCEKFKAYLEQRLKSANSVLSYFGRLKSALNQAVRDNKMSMSPARSVTIKKTQTLPRYLTLDEIKKLEATPANDPNTSNAFLFSAFTGFRISDVQSLTWTQVVDGHISYRQKKTGAAQRIPLGVQAKKILDEQRKVSTGPKVFDLPSTPAIDSRLKTWAKSADVQPFSFHASRHSFAVLCIDRGIDLYTVSGLLGHKNIQTTQIYTKITDTKKQTAVAMLPTL